MQEVLNDTHNQEDHGEGQTSNSQNAEEGQAGISSVEHRDQVGNGIGDPITDGIKNRQNRIENRSSSLQNTHLSNLQILLLTVVHYGYLLVAAHRFERDLQG